MASPRTTPSGIIGPNPPFPPYPPIPHLPDLKLPASRLGCLLLGGLAGFALATLLYGSRDTASMRRPQPRTRIEAADEPE